MTKFSPDILVGQTIWLLCIRLLLIIVHSITCFLRRTLSYHATIISHEGRRRWLNAHGWHRHTFCNINRLDLKAKKSGVGAVDRHMDVLSPFTVVIDHYGEFELSGQMSRTTSSCWICNAMVLFVIDGITIMIWVVPSQLLRPIRGGNPSRWVATPMAVSSSSEGGG